MKRPIAICYIFVLLLAAAGQAPAQGGLTLASVKGSSKVRVGYLKKSVVIDLDTELSGTNGTLPGDEPHRFAVLFRTEKAGYLYLVARVCSASPISNPMAPCGGDRPCAMLWIKTDKALKEHEIQCEIYASCSYNYYDSKVKLTKTGLDIEFGGSEMNRMIYDNAAADKGLVVKNIE
jgi:hypothetical protein